MTSADVSMWVVRAGRHGEANDLFLKGNCVALSFEQVPNPGLIPPDREAFKAKALEAYPGIKLRTASSFGGQLFRFVHEMQKGDIVLYPSKLDRHVHIGRITGDYKYDQSVDKHYPNLRTVEWLDVPPRLGPIRM